MQGGLTRRTREEKNKAEERGDGCRNESGEKGRDEHSRDEKRSGNGRIEESGTMIIFVCLMTNSRVLNPSLKAWTDCITSKDDRFMLLRCIPSFIADSTAKCKLPNLNKY